jgi:hypothetical protein
MSKQDHAVLKLEQKERLLSTLQLLVIKYEKSVLASCAAWQSLQICINGALSALNEIINVPPSATEHEHHHADKLISLEVCMKSSEFFLLFLFDVYSVTHMYRRRWLVRKRD